MALALVVPAEAVEAVDHGTTDSGPPPARVTAPGQERAAGATGEPIPCRCRFRGNAYRLGDTVCMTTHLGVQLARCDLFLNNTSWVPTGVPCTMSLLPRRRPVSG